MFLLKRSNIYLGIVQWVLVVSSCNSQSVTISQSSVSVVSGAILNLTCDPVSNEGSYSFVWKKDGVNVFESAFASYYSVIPTETNGTLIFNPPIQNLSGIYSCELNGDSSQSASANVSIAPGCLPAPFRLNAAVGETVTTSCQTINPAFNPRGVLTWKCMANQTWNGHLTGCTFSGDAKRVHLLAFTLQGPQDEIYNNASAIQRELVSLLNIGGTSHVAYIGRDETYGRSLFVLSLLNVAASAQSAFDSLRTQSQTEGFTLDGFPASPYEPSSAVWKGYVYFRGFAYCSCPLWWSSSVESLSLTRLSPVNLCNASDYIQTPCRCQDPYNASSCQCSAAFQTLSGRCSLDSDGDGINNILGNDNCEDCCLGEIREGIEWPTTPQGMYYDVKCATLHSSLKGIVRRVCGSNGSWRPVDYKSCFYYPDRTITASVIVARVSTAGNITTSLLEQQFGDYFSGFSESAMYSNVQWRTTLSNKAVVIQVDFPIGVNSTLLSIFQRNGLPPGNYSFSGQPQIIGFTATSAGGCLCNFEDQQGGSLEFKEVCIAGVLEDRLPCTCSLNDCQCGFPFVASIDPGTNSTRCEHDTTINTVSVQEACSVEDGSRNCSAGVYQPAFRRQYGTTNWPELPPCSVYKQECRSAVGTTERACNASGVWEEQDYSNCFDITYTQCQRKIADVESAISASVHVIEGARLDLRSTSYAVYADVLDGTVCYAFMNYPNSIQNIIEIFASYSTIARNTNYFAIPSESTFKYRTPYFKRLFRLMFIADQTDFIERNLYVFRLWKEWAEQSSGAGVISYLAAFEQLCVEFARVLPLDPTVTPSSVNVPNHGSLPIYGWGSATVLGTNPDPKAVSISAYMEYLPTSYRGDRQYSVLNSTPSIVFAALPQDIPVAIGYHQRLHWDAPYDVSSQGSWEIHNDSVLVHVGQECLNSVFSASIPFRMDPTLKAKCVVLSYNSSWVDTNVTTTLTEDGVICKSSSCGWHTVFYKYPLAMEPQVVTVDKGMAFTLNCTVNGTYYHSSEILWRVNGSEIGSIAALRGVLQTSTRENATEMETVYTLTVDHCSQCPGLYSCEYSDDPSTAVSSQVLITSTTGPTYSLTLTAHPSSEAPTGGEVYLNCSIVSSDVPSELQVEWKLNDIPISSYPAGSFVTTRTGNTHILHVVRAQTTLSGHYTCELKQQLTELAATSQNVTIRPGCLPQLLLPAAEVSGHFAVSCSVIHTSLRGTMEWTCLSNLNVDGHLNCFFEENANRSIAVVTNVLSGVKSDIQRDQQRIKDDIDSRIQGIFGISLSSQIIEIRHLGYSLVEFALSVELETVSSVMFASLAANTSSGFTPGGYTALPNLIGSPIMNPSDSCTCPVFYRNIQPQFTPGSPLLPGCRGPSYVRSPCRCDPGSYRLQSCNCSGVYTTVTPDSNGIEQCALDTDGDGIPDSRDPCLGCCPEDVSEGILWSQTLQGLSHRRSCSLFHSSFNEDTFVSRKCSSKGQWLPVDVSGCTFKQSTQLSVVVMVVPVHASRSEIQSNETAFKNQLVAQYLSEYNVSSVSVSMYTPGQEEGVTVVTCSLELPEDAVDSVVRRYSGSRKKRNFVFSQEPVVYGFRPANECLCQDPNEISNASALTNICKGTSLSPCLCDGMGCQCLSPFVSVSSDNEPLKCSLDSDGDGIPDHTDANPNVFDTSQLQPVEGCQAQEGVVCGAGSTTSPNLDWYEVSACREAVVRCSPELADVIGQARRFCSSTGQWDDPDISQCESVAVREAGILVDAVLSSISDSVIVQEGGILALEDSETIQRLNAASESLLNTTTVQGEALLPRDLSNTVSLLSSFATVTETTTLLASTNFSAQNLFGVTSNILDVQNNDTWSTAMAENSNVGPVLLNATERLAYSFAVNANISSPRIVQDNLVVDAQFISSRSVDNVGIARDSTASPSVSIPGSVIAERQAEGGRGEGTPVVVVFIDRLSEYLPRRLNQMTLNDSTTLSSMVSVQVGIESRSFENQSTVDITFTGISTTASRTCVFWNYSSPGEDSESGGEWSTNGVSNYSVGPGDPGTVVCRTTHLTNFAILVSPAQVLPPVVHTFLVWISYIGCAISFLCLLATIGFLLSLRKELLTKLNQFVHLNFCIALACGLLIFMAGAEPATPVPVLCKIIAFLLHYFFLASFFWMLCEAVVMYNLLVRVFYANDRKWLFLYIPLGWGAPLPIALISVAIRHEQYIILDQGQPLACWLSWDYGTIAAFIVPMCLVLLVNAVLTVFVMRSLYRFYKGFGGEYNIQNDETKAKELVKKLLKAFLFILPLLGFTWIVGLLAVNTVTVPFAVIFILLNSLQGAAIFVFYVLRHEKVRPKLSSLFTRCKRIRPSLVLRRRSLARIPPTESMEVLTPGTPTTTKATFSMTPSKLATTSLSSSDTMEKMDTMNCDEEMQEETVTFEEPHEGRKVSTYSFTLHEDSVISSASTHVDLAPIAELPHTEI